MSGARAPELALDGRRALVTGASRGIGLAAARALAASGARVACVARHAARLEAAVQGIGPRACAVAADLVHEEGALRALDGAHAALGDWPDILVNNAGVFAIAALEATAPDEFARTMELNVVAPFRLLHALLPHLRARGAGHLVTVGSVADRHVFPGNGAYAASKFGARAMHEALRAELLGSGIRATLISPSPVDTPIWDAIDPDTRPGFTPRRAMLAPDDVADAIVWAVTRPVSVNVDEVRLSRS